jgi:hypothetical protein
MVLCLFFWPIDLSLQVRPATEEGQYGGVILKMAVSWDSAYAFTDVCHFHIMPAIDLFSMGAFAAEPGPQ